jgi:hypothetical protein
MCCTGAQASSVADLGQQGFAVVALQAVDLDLDQFMRLERTVDFLQHRFGETILADADDRAEVVGFGAQFASALGS